MTFTYKVCGPYCIVGTCNFTKYFDHWIKLRIVYVWFTFVNHVDCDYKFQNQKLRCIQSYKRQNEKSFSPSLFKWSHRPSRGLRILILQYILMEAKMLWVEIFIFFVDNKNSLDKGKLTIDHITKASNKTNCANLWPLQESQPLIV